MLPGKSEQLVEYIGGLIGRSFPKLLFEVGTYLFLRLFDIQDNTNMKVATSTIAGPEATLM